MVDISPLRGIRYSPAFTRPTVYAPPYDVISEAQRGQLLGSDAHNAVRLTLGAAGDEQWYAQAAAALQAWLEQGVLVREDQPCFYGYEQHFCVAGHGPLVRRGFIGRVKLSAWGGGIHRHERTRLGPRLDRLRLMRAMHCQMSPVFGLYEDAEGAIMAALQAPDAPLFDGEIDGVRQVVWRIEDQAQIETLVEALAERDLIIADGHHRYETALTYRDERRAVDGSAPGSQPYDHVMMYMASVDDPGMVVLATHRVVTLDPEPDWRALLAALGDDFEVTPAPPDLPLTDAIAAQPDDPVTIGACLGEAGSWILRLKDATRAQAAAQRTGFSPELANLDVVVLQNLILDAQLGITPQTLAESDQVDYTIHEREACARVANGQAQAAFVLNPTNMRQIWDASIQGLTMPQKSTYFYPKLLTGLVFNPLDRA